MLRGMIGSPMSLAHPNGNLLHMTHEGPFDLYLESFPREPALDLAVSAVLQQEVAEGSRGASIRVHGASRMVLFGRRDTHESGYAEAVRAARNLGFTPVERLAGGRAAVFHAGTVGISVITPEADSTVGIRGRFTWVAGATVAAFQSLGIDARLGAVAGEYCPGEFSVNASGERKLAGFAQRLVRGAAHVTGVVVVDDPMGINAVLAPVYGALGLAMDPTATGSVGSEAEGIGTVEFIQALIAAFPATLHEASLPRALVEAARARVPSLISPCR